MTDVTEAIQGTEVTSVPNLLDKIEKDYTEWGTPQRPWFRGEPTVVNGKKIVPLLPRVYRPKEDGSSHDENALNQYFRMRSPTLGLPIVPERGEIDKWLFVARHVGLPTRLLDWTELSMIALHFALDQDSPVVWMLNPYELNRRAFGDLKTHDIMTVDPNHVTPNEPTITWGDGPYSLYIRDAWSLGNIVARIRQLSKSVELLPMAITPTFTHPRMHAQRSRFTIHPTPRNPSKSLDQLVGPKCLRRYDIKIDQSGKEEAREHLRRFGITHSALFPEPEGLAEELRDLF